MLILLYGFGPYRQFDDNVTEEILRKISRRRGLTKVVFPVKFNRFQFTQAITRYKPQWILGLGQCSRGRFLRIETRAINRRRSSKKAKARPIVPRGAPKLFTNLRLDLGRHARRCHNAGDYVCNFSIYVILEALRRRRLAIRYGFVHVPYDYNAGKAARLIEKALGPLVEKELVSGQRVGFRDSR
jgi:pyrrolidone-carboxylate peptidase